MRPGLLLATVFTIGALPVFVRSSPAANGPTIRTEVTLVKTGVSVYDRNTRAPIHDLGAGDFQVHDEGEPREIVYFGKESGPLDLVLLLDVSGTMRESLPEVSELARSALRALEDGDRTAVLAFGKSTTVTQGLTADREAAASGIRGAFQARVGLDTDIN